MTPRERFLACMRFQPVDRLPLWEWDPWPSTLRRWQRETLGEGKTPSQFAEYDSRLRCPVDLWMLPRYQERMLREDEESITVLSDRGVVTRTFKDPDKMSMSQFMEYPVKGREDWEKLKKRFDPNDPARYPKDWAESCERWRRTDSVLIFQGPRAPSLFGFLRELLGVERALVAFYDEPELVHDIMEFNTEFLIALLRRVLREAPITTIFFWEDMCYRNGPLISPRLFREFMVPRYKRITDFVRSKGTDIIMVDCDGDVTELIPLWLESGINGVYPMEVAAGMDVAKLRKEYGRDLLMTGGIDKRVLAQDRRAIDRELAARIPVAEKGGYIPHLDHLIPDDVPYENFAYYCERKKEMFRCP